VDEFILEISDRFEALSDDEKDIIRGMVGTPEYNVLSKVFGSGFMRQIVLDKPNTVIKKRRGLGTR
tara:strand:+ start:702 stop:899 length:198 start_codon:yes stop_codon:yes gene_type:complete